MSAVHLAWLRKIYHAPESRSTSGVVYRPRELNEILVCLKKKWHVNPRRPALCLFGRWPYKFAAVYMILVRVSPTRRHPGTLCYTTSYEYCECVHKRRCAAVPYLQGSAGDWLRIICLCFTSFCCRVCYRSLVAAFRMTQMLGLTFQL